MGQNKANEPQEMDYLIEEYATVLVIEFGSILHDLLNSIGFRVGTKIQ